MQRALWRPTSWKGASSICKTFRPLPKRPETANAQPRVGSRTALCDPNKSWQVPSRRVEGKRLNQISGHMENYNSKSLHSPGHRNKRGANTDLRKACKIPVAQTSVQTWSTSNVTACPFSYPNSSKKYELDIGPTHKLCASSMRCNFKAGIYSPYGKYRTIDHFLGKNEVLSIQDVLKLNH